TTTRSGSSRCACSHPVSTSTASGSLPAASPRQRTNEGGGSDGFADRQGAVREGHRRDGHRAAGSDGRPRQPAAVLRRGAVPRGLEGPERGCGGAAGACQGGVLGASDPRGTAVAG